MCRDINDENGARRCPCDTSEARQARRLAARARGQYGDHRGAPTQLVTEVASSVPVPPSASIERVAELRGEVQDLNERYSRIFLTQNGEQPRVYEVDGVEYTSSIDAAQAMNAAMERRVIEAGAQISELAAQRSGVAEDAMQGWYEGESARLKAIMEGPRPDYTPEQLARITAINEQIADAEREREAFEALHRDDYPHETLSSFAGRIQAHRAKHPFDEASYALYSQHLTYTRREQTLVMNKAAIDRERSAPLADAEQAYNRLRSEQASTHPDLAVMMADRADAYRAILGEIRPMGGVQLVVSSDSKKDRAKLLQDALENYPAAWIEASNAATDRRPLRIKFTGGRAHYSDGRVQKKSKRFPKMRVYIQPEGWQPDGTSARDNQMIKLEPKPSGDYEYEVAPGRTYNVSRWSISPGDAVWIAPQMDTYYARGGQDSDPNWSPGKGYIREEETWTDREGNVNKRVVWLKPKYEQVQVEAKVTAELTIDDDGKGFMGRRGYTTAIHEFAHRVESSGPGLIGRMEDTFLQRRRQTDENGEKEKLRAIYAGRSEYAYEDKFASKYMGKVYDRSVHKEILSTGMESIFGGSYGGLMGTAGMRRDDDMRHFILGLLATA